MPDYGVSGTPRRYALIVGMLVALATVPLLTVLALGAASVGGPSGTGTAAVAVPAHDPVVVVTDDPARPSTGPLPVQPPQAPPTGPPAPVPARPKPAPTVAPRAPAPVPTPAAASVPDPAQPESTGPTPAPTDPPIPTGPTPTPTPTDPPGPGRTPHCHHGSERDRSEAARLPGHRHYPGNSHSSPSRLLTRYPVRPESMPYTRSSSRAHRA